MLDIATEYLLNASHIVIFGISPNISLGEIFRCKLITIGKQIVIARSGETGIRARTLGSNDCAIMISYTGNNYHAEPLSHVDTLLRANVPMIGITSGGDNYIRRKMKCVLTISSKERSIQKFQTSLQKNPSRLYLNFIYVLRYLFVFTTFTCLDSVL